MLSVWGIGYNQHIHGQNNTVSLINLMALSGDIGRPGCGPCSMAGQPVPRGLEIKIGEKLAWLQSLDEEVQKS